MDILFPYSESKLKPYLKMATQRISIANNKRGTASKKHKREIAKLLEDGKAEKAIIKVEHVIRDDYTMEAYEIIELMCDLLHERVRYLSKSESCPPDMCEAVSTVLWATTRVDINELEGIKKQLSKKYGKEFCDICENNSRNTVNSRVMHKLNITPPGNLLIRSYLQEIAREYKVDW
jgi:vacuolar protein sorting-associated protein IST1